MVGTQLRFSGRTTEPYCQMCPKRYVCLFSTLRGEGGERQITRSYWPAGLSICELYIQWVTLTHIIRCYITGKESRYHPLASECIIQIPMQCCEMCTCPRNMYNYTQTLINAIVVIKLQCHKMEDI